MSYNTNKQIPHFVRNDNSSYWEINGSNGNITPFVGGNITATSVLSFHEMLSFRKSEATEKTFNMTFCGYSLINCISHDI